MSSSEVSKTAPRRTISTLEGVAFVIGIVVGVGIFRLPPLVAMNTPNELVYMLLWLAGGVAMLIGMLCYAEIASAYPDSGGEYSFLRRAYGHRLSVLFVWARGTVIQTGAIAYVAFVFGDYATQILALGAYSSSVWAALAVIVFSGVNLAGTQPGKRTQLFFVILTLGAVVAVTIAGLLSGPASISPQPVVTASGHALGLAMVFVFLTYGGWNEVAYLSGEMKDPRRDMVRLALLGTAIITFVYLALNWAYISVFGFAGLRESKAVGADLMRVVLGDTGAFLLALVVCCAALSTLNATIFTGARAYFALGRDFPAFRHLGVWSPRGENPANAFMLQGAIALALVGFGGLTRDGFTTMVEYTAPVFWFFLMLTAISQFVFRWREPDAHRPFLTPLYPLTPAIFVAICAYLLYSSVMYTGYGALFGIGVLALGVPLAYFSRPAPLPVSTEQAGAP